MNMTSKITSDLKMPYKIEDNLKADIASNMKMASKRKISKKIKL